MAQLLTFRFREIDDSVAAQLEHALDALPENESAAVIERDLGESVLLSRRECMAKLIAAIRKDYEENIQQEPQEPWSFDYMVERAVDSTLSVMTRLSAKAEGSMGNVLYGATILRLGPDSYAVWSDFA